MEPNNSPEPQRYRSRTEESGADVRGYLDAISRNRRLIALVVGITTGVVLLLSLVLPKSYEAVARISLDTDTGVLGTTDAESTQRQLATLETLLTSREVLESAAEEVPGETVDSLEQNVESSVDEQANIINVAATDGDPEQAAAIAQAVANSFLEVEAAQERERLEAAQQDLQTQIEVLADQPSTEDGDVQIAAIQERLSQIAVDLQLAGSELQIAQPAEVPDAASSPRPLRNTVLAFFGSLVIGVLLALARDQLRPGLRGPREVSRLAGGLPILGAIPNVRRGLSRSRTARTSAAEHEAYLTLRAAVRMAVPPERGSIILVTSALHGEGKSTVTARLGRGLAQAGHPTLLISADLRVPTLEKLFRLPRRPGLTEEITRLADEPTGGKQDRPLRAHRLGAPESAGRSAYRLDVLSSGEEPPDPSTLLASKAAERFFKEVRSFKYDYVLVDTPPLLGIADVQALAQHADEVLFVARLDQLTPDALIDANDIFSRLDIRPMGVVVVGAKAEATPYHYMQQRTRPEELAGRLG
jgi:Mrp family chromosome partitioning ATPase/capsular polysaccharide biosynthesis protein